MSKNPNTVKSQDDVIVNQGSRSSDVLISAIEKCKKLEAENKELRAELKYVRESWRNSSDRWYKRCKEWFLICIIVNLLWFCWSLYVILWG